MEQNQDFQPVALLKVYKQNYDNYYIEKHNIVTRNGKQIISSGNPLTEKQLKRIVRYISSEDRDARPLLKNRWLEGNVLSVEPNPNHFHLMWYEPAQKRSISCSENCVVPSGEYHFPALLYLTTEDSFHVYAMRTNKKRPKLNTKLYVAPILNTMGDNSMCWGSAEKGKTSFVVEEEIERWNRAMWGSKFTHPGAIRATKIPLDKAYKIAAKEAFPAKEMISARVTIKDLLRKL